MAYIINKSDGTQLVSLEDASLDTTTSLTLVGRNYIGYGEIQNENFLYLLENFANNTAPLRPIAGQLWFDTGSSVLKSYDGTKWIEVGASAMSATPPVDPQLGGFWFKTPSNTLHVWDGTQWVFIGPETAEGFGITRAQADTLLSTTGSRYPVIKLMVNGVATAIISSVGFTIDASEAIAGFSDLAAGITLSTSHKAKGNLEGVADRATILDTTRLINGVGFNGSRDITIKSSTTSKLIGGDYIVGSDFDGSTAETWAVDATANNTIGKVVARDASGNFAAGTITADLVGDVQGNVTVTTGNSTFNTVTANAFIGATLSGNSNTTTKLRTPRNINGVAFDGTADITVTADAFTLTGSALANNVTTSALENVGTLTNLGVAGNITINSNLIISNSSGAIVTANRTFDIKASDGTGSTTLKLISPDVSSLAGTGAIGGLVPSTTLGADLGKSNLKFKNAHAETFNGDLIGNASTATLAGTATNIGGGTGGDIPYQTAAGATSLLPAGTAGQVLRTGGPGNPPTWGTVTFATLNVGAYLTGSNYDGIANTTLNVDADTANTANKVVARDGSGNFAAGTITANLTGNVTGNTNGTHTGNVVGNVTGNVVGDLTGTATNATNASLSTTQPAGTSNTTIATTAFVQSEIARNVPRTMTISGPFPNTTSPDPEYIDLIQAYIPANSVAAGTTFDLMINQLFTSSVSSFSAARWILAYRWATASVSTSTTLYESGVDYILTYRSNGSVWSYTGTWRTI